MFCQSGDNSGNRKSIAMSEEAQKRYAWFEYYEKCGRNARKTCRHFGISPDTFYRWKKRYRPEDPSSLEDEKKSSRPKQKRSLSISRETTDRIKVLLETHSVNSKKEIQDLLKKENIIISLPTLYRIINRLEAEGQPFLPQNRKGNGKNDRKIKGYEAYLSLLNLWNNCKTPKGIRHNA